jgi:WD40 repeat protein
LNHALWDTATGKQLLVTNELPAEFVMFSPDGRLLAAGDTNGTIRLWSVPKLLAQKGKK